MLIAFPCDALQPRSVEPDFEPEYRAARAAGFPTALLDFERLARGEPAAALAALAPDQPTALLRGWMLTPAQYANLYGELQRRGVSLLNDPAAYRTCHYLPDSYRWIAGWTAPSTWFEVAGELELAKLHEAIAPFGHKSLIVKDYVKSQKHYWTEACFIPDASDLPAVERVVRRFLELQGPDLNQGLVLRELLPLRIVGRHPQSDMPVAAEFRSFWYDSVPILVHRYWADLTAIDATLPLDQLQLIAARIPSRFFTMDVAQLEDGSWRIIELGDGQTAGLPSPALADSFYQAIATAEAISR